jgi:hypothetical protein
MKVMDMPRTTIAINNAFDVVLARMRVRQQARATGFGVREQACIALATSSLVRALRLGEANEGRVDIYHTGGEERASVQVVCTGTNDAKCDFKSKAFADARWMVDKLTVEMLPPGGVTVTLVKWAT